MVFNATFNNISVISWRSVLLVDDRKIEMIMCIYKCIYKKFRATLGLIYCYRWR